MSCYDTFDDDKRPFDFADLNGKPDPEKWGPKYSKQVKTPRVNVDRFPTNCASGQKYDNKREIIDPKIRALAESFLAGVPGVKPEDTTELAESIQHLCENFRRILVNAAHEAGIRY